ncbi:hypothetical protein Bhyg_09450 [Pseudolycoriella hygida]|uniref:Uncharacterized protein n=1 Tax=Pseudolycoriella hygida TaxID=35572 RepID=A0A9Q0N816_9DIPT|nr:hypothetical protein Bhyg_09450 [Pseudolycoriella hygida]
MTEIYFEYNVAFSFIRRIISHFRSIKTSKMQISKSDPKIKQETYTKYDENKETDFNSNIDLEFKKIGNNEKPLVEDSKVTSKRFSPLLRQIIASSGPILATVAAGKHFLYSFIFAHVFSPSDSYSIINILLI